MADGIQMDFSEILQLAADLGTVPDNAGEDIRDATEETAVEIMKDWRDSLKGARNLPGAARSVTYEMGSRGESIVREMLNEGAGGLSNAVVAEIGPVLSGQGPLAGMIDYGTPTIGPRGYGAAALERHQADFEKRLSHALEQAEKKAGLL